MNIYSAPEHFGMEVVGEVADEGACYSFNMVVVWREVETGKLFYDTDSGCSCPSPFEDIGREGLIPLERLGSSLTEFAGAMRQCGASLDDRTALERRVDQILG
jgi:hypothetical protein